MKSRQDRALRTGLQFKPETNVAALRKKNTRKKQTHHVQTKREKLGVAQTAASLRQIRRALKLGQAHAQRSEWAEAVPYLLVAWEAFPEDIHILTTLAHGLAKLGVREKSIELLQATLEMHEPTAEVCSVMQQLALDMGYHEIAVKLGYLLVTMEPERSVHYINLFTSLNRNEQFEEAIEYNQKILPMFPENADLWNVLGTSVRFRDGREAAIVFHEEALRLAPNDYKILGNLAAITTDVNKAGDYYKKALELEPTNPEPHLGYAFNLMRRGDLEEAWDHYKERFHPRRVQSQMVLYTHNVPEWDGGDLTGKKLFVTAEQGIGDEMMFGNYLPFLYDRAEQLAIGCDPRLISIYQRRFPNAIVDSYVDRFREGYRYRLFPKIQHMLEQKKIEFDCSIPVASAQRYEWLEPQDIKPHPDGFLNAEPGRVNDFAQRIGNADKPVVGLAWSSEITTGIRQGIYMSLEDLGPIMALKDHVHFVNLMYFDVTDDLAKIKDMYGVDIQTFDDINMKQDIEANLAIMKNCDIVVSSCSAPGMFALSSGRPTILMSRDIPWWCFGSKNEVLFAEDAHFMAYENGTEWPVVLDRTVKMMCEKLNIPGNAV